MTGVQNIQVSRDDDGIRLDRWFKRHFPGFSHVAMEKALRKGDIRVDKKRAKSNLRLEEGQMVRVPPFKPKTVVANPVRKAPKWTVEQEDKLVDSVIFRNSDILVINKPAGLSVQGGSGIKLCLDDMLGCLQFEKDERPKLVHRLDKDTSGVLLLARRPAAAAYMAELFRSKQTEKIYWAVLVGVPEQKEGKISNKIMKTAIGKGKEKVRSDDEGKVATTYYRVLDTAGKEFSLVELIPITGRTHQLRVHMAEAGTPILGDGKYGGKLAFGGGITKDMHLHARQLTMPYEDKPLKFEAELPGHFVATLKLLGFPLKKRL
jgi:23S rRNA pseudouridine955/2504/2580 synthase